MSALAPRAVFVTRPTDLESLLARHATHGQADFFLKSRGQSIGVLEQRHDAFLECQKTVLRALPEHWRHAAVTRDRLSRFVFAEQDFIVAIGQDGLIANLAKYSNGRPVLGVNPEPTMIEGVLAKFSAGDMTAEFPRLEAGNYHLQPRTMVEAKLENGSSLMALNEIFVGHQSHQSARYEISFGDASESQSSSGLIVASGTGMTGWAKSIVAATRAPVALEPCESSIAYFAREPWPSLSTGAEMRCGKIPSDQRLIVRSEMNDGGVVFADGIEADRMAFDWGLEVSIAPAREKLNLVVRE